MFEGIETIKNGHVIGLILTVKYKNITDMKHQLMFHIRLNGL
jgi:hypothetical protein